MAGVVGAAIGAGLFRLGYLMGRQDAESDVFIRFVARVSEHIRAKAEESNGGPGE